METYERDDTRVVNIIFMVIMTVLLWPVNCYSYVLSGLFEAVKYSVSMGMKPSR